MKNIILFLVLVISLNSQSQNDIGGTSLSDGFKMTAGSLKGHPYLLKEWVPGFAIDLNGKMSEEKLLNYDIFQNRLTFKRVNASEDIMVVNISPYSGFILMDADKYNYLFTKIEGSKFKKPKKESKFYQIAKAPSKNVIIESIKTIKDPSASGWSSSSLTTKRAEFVMLTKIYVMGKEGKYVKTNPSKSSILKVFKDQKKALSAYIKENNITIKTAVDLVPVVAYYYSL